MDGSGRVQREATHEDGLDAGGEQGVAGAGRRFGRDGLPSPRNRKSGYLMEGTTAGVVTEGQCTRSLS